MKKRNYYYIVYIKKRHYYNEYWYIIELNCLFKWKLNKEIKKKVNKK